ncbi:hypothetical protein D3C85_1884560 [compost metagenome]
MTLPWKDSSHRRPSQKVISGTTPSRKYGWRYSCSTLAELKYSMKISTDHWPAPMPMMATGVRSAVV